jgi:hypothetical protein
VVAAGESPESGQFNLIDPNGVVRFLGGSDPAGRWGALRVADPAPGTWLLEYEGGSADPVVEVAVRSRVQLFTSVQVLDPTVDSEPGSPDPIPVAGSDIAIRAIPTELGAMRGCSVVAKVSVPLPSSVIAPPTFFDDSLAPEAPPGAILATTIELTLVDDGKHFDGEPGDGVYGALFPYTALGGQFDVSIELACTSPLSGSPVVRQARHGFFVRPLTASEDADGDGMPDAWERQYGLDPTDPADAHHDADGDGLTNFEEFFIGTSPVESDTDGGGESDGSEVANGRNPRFASDDAADRPETFVIPGNQMTYVALDTELQGVTAAVQRSTDDGPFTTIGSNLTADFTLDTGVVNERRYCYRTRLERSGAIGGWSTPVCVTPRIDPFPPRVREAFTSTKTHTRDVDLAFTLEETGPGFRGPALPVDLGVTATPVTDMRVWFGSGPPPSGLAWQPYTSSVPLRLEDAIGTIVSVQVRDEAGNESEVLRVPMRRPMDTPLAKALALEESAEDALDRGDYAAARAAIDASIDEVEKLLDAAFQRIAETKGKSEDDLHIVRTLLRIQALKLKAKALMKPATEHLAREALEEAIALELELIAWAAERGIEL